MTAETAVVLPAVVVVLAAALWAVATVGAQLQCVDAARAGARAAARGEPVERVRADVLALAPMGAVVRVDVTAETVRVEVAAHVRPRWGSLLPAVEVGSSAVAAPEPGVPGVSDTPGASGGSEGEP
ncbi:TadE family type IV pilus minor pilin [Streptosporangium sp. NPDC004379]|uniref:TadE family type IV pilus minor pilin n=1 Tax=Streptosporangium sp. NPDC004379 TaxID=3366189 RepID=UPI0036A4A90C